MKGGWRNGRRIGVEDWRKEKLVEESLGGLDKEKKELLIRKKRRDGRKDERENGEGIKKEIEERKVKKGIMRNRKERKIERIIKMKDEVFILRRRKRRKEGELGIDEDMEELGNWILREIGDGMKRIKKWKEVKRDNMNIGNIKEEKRNENKIKIKDKKRIVKIRKKGIGVKGRMVIGRKDIGKLRYVIKKLEKKIGKGNMFMKKKIEKRKKIREDKGIIERKDEIKGSIEDNMKKGKDIERRIEKDGEKIKKNSIGEGKR